MKKIIVSGFGGQGVLSLGLFIAYAAMAMDRNVAWLPSYGPEMRGGTANCAVTVSQEEIACPIISHPDILVAMNAPSVDKFASSVVKGGVILVNRSAMQADVTVDGVDVLYVPVDDLAGGTRGGNLVMLGVLLDRLGITRDAAEAAIRKVFQNKPQSIDGNLRCLDAGISFAENLGVAV